MHNIPKWAADCAVNDCNTVEEFFSKHMKPERYTARGKDYVKAVVENGKEHLKLYGYAAISHHSTICGKFITFLHHE